MYCGHISSYYYCFIEIPVFNANRVDPDQTSFPSGSTLFCHLPFLGFPN